MIIWCSGISGSGRKDYLREVAAYFEEQGQRCRVFEFGELLAKVQGETRIADDATTLLDGNPVVLDVQRSAAFRRLVDELRGWPAEDVAIISNHACFMRRGRLQTAMDMAQVKAHLAPIVDFYATVVDGAFEVYARQQEHAEWRGHLTVAEIAIWRDFETTLTQVLATYESKPFYVLARAEPPEMLYRLCQRPLPKRIYLSYPITAITKTNPELLEEASALGARLRDEGYVVYNPMAVDDTPVSLGNRGLSTRGCLFRLQLGDRGRLRFGLCRRGGRLRHRHRRRRRRARPVVRAPERAAAAARQCGGHLAGIHGHARRDHRLPGLQRCGDRQSRPESRLLRWRLHRQPRGAAVPRRDGRLLALRPHLRRDRRRRGAVDPDQVE